MRRTFWIGLAAVVLVSALIVGLANWTLDPAGLKPRLIEAAERATGRKMTIDGPIGLSLSLVPTITMRDVALTNPPGFSRPDMITVSRVELGLALMPLLRHRFEVDHVTLVRPDVALETDQSGHSNWVFGRGPPTPAGAIAAHGEAPAGAHATRAGPDSNPPEVIPPPTETPGYAPLLKDVRVEDGQVAWSDAAGHRQVVAIERLKLTEPAIRLAQIEGTLTYEGRVIQVSARTGSVADLRSAFGAAPWPVSLKLQSDRTTLTVDGTIDHPLVGRGYAFTVDADVPDPASLAALLPRLPLAGLGEVSAHAELRDDGGPVPAVTALRVNVASVAPDWPARGARLTDVSLSGQPRAPLSVAARLSLGGVDSRIAGTIGDLGWLTGGRSGPIAVNLGWAGASGRATVRGTIQAPRRLAGYDLAVSAEVPDPAQVWPDAPTGLKAVVLRTQLTDGMPSPFEITSTAGDLEGELTVTHPSRWSVTGAVASRHLDLDMLRGASSGTAPAGGSVVRGGPAAATPSPGTASGGVASGGAASDGAASGGAASGGPSGGPVSAGQPRGPAAVGSLGGPATAGAPPGAAATGGSGRIGEPAAAAGPLIPNDRLPFRLIRAVDGSINFTLAHVLLDGADLRRISGTLSAKAGTLRVDPFNIAAPDQRLSGVLVADAATDPPRVHLAFVAPGLALQPLLGALGLPGVATGNVAVRADLTGEGDSPRAIAGSLNGSLGAAVEGGQVDAQMVNSFLGPLRPLRMEGPEMTDLRCFAVRADAKSGVVAIDPLALNTAALIIEGNGDVNLRDETLALRLRPRGKIGGTGIALPVRLSGPWRDPSAKVDISGRGFGGGALAGLLLGGKDIMGAAGGGDPCPAALARARDAAAEAPAARP